MERGIRNVLSLPGVGSLCRTESHSARVGRPKPSLCHNMRIPRFHLLGWGESRLPLCCSASPFRCRARSQRRNLYGSSLRSDVRGALLGSMGDVLPAVWAWAAWKPRRFLAPMKIATNSGADAVASALLACAAKAGTEQLFASGCRDGRRRQTVLGVSCLAATRVYHDPHPEETDHENVAKPSLLSPNARRRGDP